MTEVWLPDLIERCQDALRRSWYADARGECWYLSRSAIERFLQEDSAGNDLPPSWQKLLSLANLSPEDLTDLPERRRFLVEDFEELRRWSNSLGGRLDLTSEPIIEVVETPSRRSSTPVMYFIAACLATVAIFSYSRVSRRLADEAEKQRSLRGEYVALQSEASQIRKDADREKQARLLALGRVEKLTQENLRLRQKQSDPPGIDLSPMLQTRNAGRSTAWDQRSPSFTALSTSPTVLTWPKGSPGGATVVIFDQATQTRVWSHPVDLADGQVSGVPMLKLGRYYQWAVFGESEDQGYAAIPFYLLSTQEVRRWNEASKAAKTEAARAAVAARFGLFDDAKRRFALGH